MGIPWTAGASKSVGRMSGTGRGFGRLGLAAALLGYAAASVGAANCKVADLKTQDSYRVEAWGVPDKTFNVGEALNLQLRVSAPSHVTLFHVSTSCKVTRLLDNVAMPMAQIIDFPARDSGMSVMVKPPAGREGFYVIATLKPLAFLSADDILSEANGVAEMDMTPAQFYRRLEQARARRNPAEWSLTTLRTRVVQH